MLPCLSEGRSVVVNCTQEVIIANLSALFIARSESENELHEFCWLYHFDRLEDHIYEFFFSDVVGSSHVMALKVIVQFLIATNYLLIDILDGR